LLISIITLTVNAQRTGTNRPVVKPVAKPVLPKLKTYWGSNVDSATVPLEEATQLVALPLRITDAQNNVYTVAVYNLLYKRLAITENEETGKTSPTTSIVAQLFKQTPLPDVWIKTMQERMKPGEEILIYDVIAKDSKGKLLSAPDLKLKIK
jgi:hypothetical protein